MSVSDGFPDIGAVFWPVGTGDSSTIVVDEQTVIQIDLHDLAKADDDGTQEVPVVDLLIEALPMGTDVSRATEHVVRHLGSDMFLAR